MATTSTLSVEPLPVPLILENIITVDQTSLTRDDLTSIDPNNPYSSCVITARLYNPDVPLMDAKDFVPNTELVEIGTIIIFYYPKSGLHHIATVYHISNEGYHLYEGNFKRNELSTDRIIQLTDKNIVGYYDTNK